MDEFPLPADALILLVGPAGAGKTTWAAARFRPSQVLSSDRFREIVADDPGDQSASADAFRLLHAAARARLRRGLPAVIDATNLTARAQRPLLALAARFGRPVVAIVFDPPLERCLAQNATRPDRVVPDDVVRAHHAGLPGAIAALRRAGVEVVHVAPGGPAAGPPSGIPAPAARPLVATP
jgi:predicted kinase